MNGDKRERTIMQAAFADLVGRAGEAAGAEGFFVDEFDFSVVGRLFRQVMNFGRSHDRLVRWSRKVEAAIVPPAPCQGPLVLSSSLHQKQDHVVRFPR